MVVNILKECYILGQTPSLRGQFPLSSSKWRLYDSMILYSKICPLGRSDCGEDLFLPCLYPLFRGRHGTLYSHPSGDLAITDTGARWPINPDVHVGSNRAN